MKSESRSEHARNEKRNSEGRFTSEHKNDDKKMSKNGTHRGENAKTEARNSKGEFTSKHDSKK